MGKGAQLVGVVGTPPEPLSTTLEGDGVSSRNGSVASVLEADPDFIVTVGETATLQTARSLPDAPIIPVDSGPGHRSVPRASIADTVERALIQDVPVQPHPVLAVYHDDGHVGRAVMDVTLLTAEVAHISEYAVTAASEDVDQFRADGVVVATPAGSPGFARRVGCPVVAPDTSVLAVAPIAPFATDPDHWVLPLDDVLLSVERDDATVSLLADEREVAVVDETESVRITPDGTVNIALLPESGPRLQ